MMGPLLLLCLFLAGVGLAVFFVFRMDREKSKRTMAERLARIADFAEAITSEIRKNGPEAFDLAVFAERCGVDGDESAEAAVKVYRGVCRKAMADGVVTDEEESLLSRLGDALELDDMGRARLRREAREAWEVDQRIRQEHEASTARERQELVRDILISTLGLIPLGKAAPLAIKSGFSAVKVAKSLMKRQTKKENRKQAVPMTPRTIRSKVSGVTFENLDGTSRQAVIRRHCHSGQTLIAIREPGNEFDRNAIGLWVPTRGLVLNRKAQIGYIGSHLNEELAPLIDERGKLDVRVLEVTGGTSGKHFGMNIEIKTSKS